MFLCGLRDFLFQPGGEKQSLRMHVDRVEK